MMTGSAAFRAASACVRSPAAMASSTLRTKLRSFERRPLLISVRRAILRVALRAELVLAMPIPVLRRRRYRVRLISQKASGGESLAAEVGALIVGRAESVNRARRPPQHLRFELGSTRPQARLAAIKGGSPWTPA